MDSLRDLILRINDKIYGYRYHEAMGLIPGLIEALIQWQSGRTQDSPQLVMDLNEILGYINQAIQDKDYLRLADVLNHELLRALESIELPKEALQ